MRALLHNQIAALWEAEQHVYGIPHSGTMISLEWAELTSEERHDLQNRAIAIWRDYLRNRTATYSHPHLRIPEYRQMLTQRNGELIVIEL